MNTEWKSPFHNFVTRCLAVPGSLNQQENVGVASFVLHNQMSERICERIVGGPAPQDAEHFGARVVVVPVPQRVFLICCGR